MRSADEAHTSVWSCDMCPLDPSKISFEKPRALASESYPRRLHSRALSDVKCASHRLFGVSTFLEVALEQIPRAVAATSMSPNTRHPCCVPSGKYACFSGAYAHCAGLFSGEIVCSTFTEEISPRCSVRHVSRYKVEDSTALGSSETDGAVSKFTPAGRKPIYVHLRKANSKRTCSVVIPMAHGGAEEVRKALLSLLSTKPEWPSITGFITRDHLASINNLSPRAWDSKRIQKRGAVYTPKIDGERVYILVFKGVAHVFSKGKGHPHLGYVALSKHIDLNMPVVVDAENTVSHGMFLIDMLTSCDGRASPRERDYSWSLREFRSLQEAAGCPIARIKPYVASLVKAEEISARAEYPTDGVIALWPRTTTSRKMKAEKSVELSVRKDGSLHTSDGDAVFERMALPVGVAEGDVVEARLKLCSNGKEAMVKPLFRRVDKASANSTSAVSAVLSSFGCVKRDDETRRREVLIWCDSLRQHLIRSALCKKGSRKIVIDIGTGTGQSLDVLTPDRGVSYLLVEPSEQRCEMLKRRTGVRKAISDPREIMSAVRSLKSGSQVYAIANMELSLMTSDEELMKFIREEIAFVSATFSAHFVVADLYDLCTYWGMPLVGCVYAYDGVEVGASLVHALGVSMRRISDTACSVKWGGDAKYTEPYTETQEYQPFCSVTRAVDVISPPNRDSDKEAWEICSKVYIIENFQGL
jgi:hypothetical protein